MPLSQNDLGAFWHLVTRLGEAQLLLPAALASGLAMTRTQIGRGVAARWALMLAVATLITLATKLAFIGWGVGSAVLNFTGISGHAMLAAAIYPVLFGTLSTQSPNSTRWLALLTGYGLALTVGISRIVVEAHSSSEVLGGFLLGGITGAVALRLVTAPRWPISVALLAVAVAWFSVVPTLSPALPTHSAVTQLALAVSGRAKPFTRRDLFRATRHSQSTNRAAAIGRYFQS